MDALAVLPRRLAAGLGVVLIASALGALLLEGLPGGADGAWGADPRISGADRAAARHDDGGTWAARYARWLGDALRLDLGRSRSTGQPVASMIAARLPASLELAAAALLLAIPAALLVGAACAAGRGGPADRSLTGASLAVISFPGFCIALLAISIFAVRLGWLPAGGRTSPAGDGGFGDRLLHLVLPALVLAAGAAARWSRYARARLLEVTGTPAFRAARAKGLGPARLWWRHALRPALPPLLTVAAMDAPGFLAGALVTETVFGWPGIGRLFHEGLQRRDDVRVMAILVLVAAFTVAWNLAADLLNARLDPRARHECAG